MANGKKKPGSCEQMIYRLWQMREQAGCPFLCIDIYQYDLDDLNNLLQEEWIELCFYLQDGVVTYGVFESPLPGAPSVYWVIYLPSRTKRRVDELRQPLWRKVLGALKWLRDWLVNL